MAKIPGSEPQAVMPNDTRVQGFLDPSEATAGDRALTQTAAQFMSKMQEAEQQQQITSGSLNTVKALEGSVQDIQQSGDWRNANEKFNASVNGLQDQIEKSDASPAVKTALLNHLGGYALTRGHDLAAWSYTQNIEDKKTTLEGNLQDTIKLAANAGPKDRQIMFQHGLAAIEGMRGNVLSDDVANKLTQVYSQNFDYQMGFADIMNNPSKAEEALKDPAQYKGLTPEQRFELSTHAEREANVQGEAAKIQVQSKAEDALESAAQTGIYDRSILSLVASTNDPKFVAKFQDSLGKALATHSVITQMQTSNPEQRAELLAGLQPKPGQDGYADQEKLYETAFKANDNIEKLAANNPAALVASRVDGSLKPGDQAIQSMAYQHAIGVPNPQPLTNEQASGMVNEYMAAPPGSKPMVMESWRAQFGTDGYNAIMHQMYSDLPPSALFADHVNQETLKRLGGLDNVTLEQINAGIGEEAASKVRKDMEPLWTRVAQALPGNAPEQSVMRQTFNKLAADFQRAGDPNAVTHAYNELFGAYDFNGTWMAPAGTDMSKLSAYGADKISKIDSIKGANSPYELSILKSSLLAGNRWQYDSEGRYYLLDMNQQPVFDANDQPITFTLPAAQMWVAPPKQVRQNPVSSGRENPI